MSGFLTHLCAFALYTLALLLLTGQTFAWNETRKLFYLGGSRYGTLMSLATFCATWMSAASLVGFTVWVMQDGYVAFAGSVHGWLLGLLPMPILVYRLRKRRAISVPEWMAAEYGDARLRRLGGVALLFAYTLYLVIQFRAFGEVASHMLQIPVGFAATALVYLFVLYTTFGGYQSVSRSDALNLCLIIAGVSLALFAAVRTYGSPFEAHAILARHEPLLLDGWRSWREGLVTLTLALAWGFGVAANPQYGVRLMAARTTSDALRVTFIAPFVVGWIYFALTSVGIICRAYLPSFVPAETGQFASFFDAALPIWASLPLLLAVLAAAVSTANSELLIAACALCNDMRAPRGRKEGTGPFRDDDFLFTSRLAVVLIASVSLFLSQIPLPGILAIGRISWTLLAVCFFLPFYFPIKNATFRGRLYAILCFSLVLHIVLAFFSPLTAEVSMLVVLGMQAAIYAFSHLAGERA